MKKNKDKRIIVGEIQKSKKGFGFIRCEEEDDVFVSQDNMGSAMNGDIVEADLLPDCYWEKSPEAIITKVITRKHQEVVGTFEKSKRFGFVVPDDKKLQDDIYVKKDCFRNAQNGDKVVVKITQYPSKYQNAEGKITEIIAKKGQVGSDILSMIRGYGLFETFPSRVNAEAKAKAKTIIDKEELSRRLDLRNENIITIDGPTAKDLDDAISVSMLPNGNYMLGVHIADVSHYVEEDGYLDKEAMKRGTSVYLINRVVPMLPKVLSNGVCSLNEGEDRLTLSCIMEIDNDGEVVSHQIRESIINSKGRMVYDDVSDILEDVPAKEDLKKRYSFLLDDIYCMGKLAEILRNKRKHQGSLDFDLEEAEIALDQDENPISVELAERRTANRLIEEFMLIANETIAEHFFWMEYPFVYRVHEKPDPEKMIELRTYLMNFGIKLKGNMDNIYPRTLADIIEEIEGKPYENMVSRVMLRTMKKAFYSTECQGHFGLAFRYYCHFTSPIRRYPDLMIHRIIKKSINGDMTEAKMEKYKGDTSEAADISSKAERRAQELEREVEKLKKTQFMVSKIGEEFPGVVSGVTEFGVYVELENTIEGMAFAKDLRRPYKLGEKVRIRVMNAKPAEREIDFLILDDENKDQNDV